ncbi:hypothetical protein IBX84_10055 [Neisseria gonorrhoeae]|nr:hypothetical protein IBX84_10055 [Neisseria gonorrhoeae]
MKLIDFEGNLVKISLIRDEFQLFQAIVGEIYSGVCVDVEDFEIMSGIRNPQLVQELEEHLIEAYNIMDTCD